MNPIQAKATGDSSGDIRREQLRLAKRRQREREKRHGLETYQLRLPQSLTEKLKEGSQHAEFVDALQAFIDHQILRISDYENLRLLAWNRKGKFVTRREALQLYERNWRHVYSDGMSTEERDLIASLAREYGNGVLNT